MKRAICALIYVNGKPLGVSRKTDTTKMGLPGGKVEEGETLKETVYREILEETGLKVISSQLIFSRLDEYGYVTDTFKCDVEGEINTTETGVVREVTWNELFEGPFGEYNRQLYDKVVRELEVKYFMDDFKHIKNG